DELLNELKKLNPFPGNAITPDSAEYVVPEMSIEKNENGEWEGVIQGGEKEIPPQLLDITKNWSFLGMPVPLP
ncbi:MAG: hypothetical protein EOM73_02900, partial [Bacteroidia bacterium]|nr:hypothetical protein [Bacteroidia bacterium]